MSGLDIAHYCWEGWLGGWRMHTSSHPLQEAFKGSRKLRIGRLATALGVHRHTLVKYLKQNGIHYKFTRLTNAEIDALVKAFAQ